VPTELIQTLVNALLLLVVACVGGTLGLRRFESVERSVAELRADVKADIAELRADVTAGIADLRTELKADLSELRGEQAQMRSDLTVVALAVGARRPAG
jgi:cell division protein FtsB